MRLTVIDTTDHQYLGLTMDLPNPILTDVRLPVSEGVTFRVDKTEDLGGGLYRYSNPHYVAIARGS